jgi:hypothetical protein
MTGLHSLYSNFGLDTVFLLGIWGCSSVQPQQHVEDIIAIQEQARLQPSNALKLCGQIQNSAEQYNLCLFSAVEMLQDQITQEQLCSNIEGMWKGECFFHIAEQHDQPQYCKQASPFVQDCLLHILEKHGGQYQSMPAMLKYVSDLGLDIHARPTQEIAYRALLHKPYGVPIQICKSSPDVASCEDIAKRIYIETLHQRKFNCTTSAPSHPLLYTEWQKAHSQHCAPK